MAAGSNPHVGTGLELPGSVRTPDELAIDGKQATLIDTSRFDDVSLSDANIPSSLWAP